MRSPGVVIPGGVEAVKRQYGVNNPDLVEVIWQPLYDYQTYPAAGQATFTFFQRSVGTNGITEATTNMAAAGSVPKGQMQLVTGIAVELYLDVADIYDPTPDQDRFLRDYYNIMRDNAFLDFFIGSKSYLKQGPLMKFPAPYRVNASTAIATGGATIEGMSFAQGAGATFNIVPIQLTSNQNFRVDIKFDAARAISNNAKFGVTLLGYNFRNSQ